MKRSKQDAIWATIVATMFWVAGVLMGSCLGCQSITDAASKIQWPKPQVIWTADNGTVTQSAPPPTTTTQPVVQKPAEQATENAFVHAAPITCTLTHKGLTAGLWTYSRTAVDWPLDDKGECQGEAHLYVWRDGRWQGGKFDHFRTALSGSRNFPNISGGYGCWKNMQPRNGERCCFVLFSYNNKDRSNAVYDYWKGN